MTRWLQSTVLGAINAELRDPMMPMTDGQFSRFGDARDFWTEQVDTRSEQIADIGVEGPHPFCSSGGNLGMGAPVTARTAGQGSGWAARQRQQKRY